MLDAGPADAGCVAAVVVEGRLLIGHGSIATAHVPATAKEHRAIEPACNDAGQNERDRAISVLTLDGVPADIAVVRRGAPNMLYVAGGSLVVSSAHPLHRALYRRTGRRSDRRRACRREPRALRGTLAQASPSIVSTLMLRRGRDTIAIEADPQTRLTNRPPYEPLRPGQRVVLQTSVCGSRRVADTIAFDGATVPPQPSETDTGGEAGLDPRWLIAGAYVTVFVALLLGIRRLGRDRG